MADEQQVETSAEASTETQPVNDEAQGALLSMWEPDGPALEDKPQDEPDAEPSEEAVAETQDDPKAETEEQPKQDKGHDRDKAIVKMQQKVAAERREREQFQTTITSALDDLKASIKAISERPATTPSQVARQDQQIDRVEDDLDSILTAVDGMDLADLDDSGTAIKDTLKKSLDPLVRKIKALSNSQPKDLKDPRVDELTEKLKRAEAFITQEEQRTKQAEGWSQFESGFKNDYPMLADRLPELVNEADRLVRIELGVPADDPSYSTRLMQTFWRSVGAAEAASKNESAETETEAETTPAIEPKRTDPNATKGTQTVKPGVSSSRTSTTKSKQTKPPMFVPDEQAAEFRDATGLTVVT